MCPKNQNLTIQDHITALIKAWELASARVFLNKLEDHFPQLMDHLRPFAIAELKCTETDGCEITYLDRLHILDELWEDADISPDGEQEFVQAFIEHWPMIRQLIPFAPRQSPDTRGD